MAEYLTGELPGTGGVLRESPEDFEVEEIPLYLPCGEGEHLYIEIEKSGIPTPEVARRLARASGCPEREIGYAGLKDAQARTRQYLSLPARYESSLKGLESSEVRILSARRHRNKLRLGHLLGNRFRLRIRHPGEDALERAGAILDVLQKRGVPNLFGEQRYGLLGNNHLIGGALLRGDHRAAIDALLGTPQAIRDRRWQEGVALFHAGQLKESLQTLPSGCRHEKTVIEALLHGASEREALQRLPRNALRLFLSAWQSRLFDTLVFQRLQNLGILEAGDLAYKHANGACFKVEDPEQEQPRAEAFEISPSGPLFGSKAPLAEGEPGARERQLLDAQQLPAKAFRLPGGLSLAGERRALRVPLQEAAVVRDTDALLVTFALPRGSFATTVMREIMKSQEHACPETRRD